MSYRDEGVRKKKSYVTISIGNKTEIKEIELELMNRKEWERRALKMKLRRRP